MNCRDESLVSAVLSALQGPAESLSFIISAALAVAWEPALVSIGVSYPATELWAGNFGVQDTG